VGTGKTYFARILGKGIINGNIKNLDDLEHWLSKLKSGDESLDELYSKKIENDRLFTVTFHQSYSYEDFIEGIRAKASGDKIEYEIEPGIFKEVCNNAKKPENKTKSYVIIIDEINRGDISRIFGELITLLDDDKRCRGENNDYLEFYLKLPYSKEDFCVPENVYVIGTMNDSDRSIALLDIALRRRFTFIKVPPNEVILERWIKDDDEFKQMVKSVFNTLN
ncbi:MAG: McrB family protein, partial [Nanopusillaceae archaeon]